MGSLSKLSEKCRKCPYVDTCKNKRMEAVAYHERPNMAEITTNNAVSITQSILRETMKINIDGNIIVAYRDDIEKQLYKSLYKGLYDVLMNSAT